jgi:hypothetical protein
MTALDTAQAVEGVMRVEQHLLALASMRDVHGFKIEWNEGLDFGHLTDPLHIALLTDGGRVDGQFRLQDLAAEDAGEQPAVRQEIERLVSAVAAMPHRGPPIHEPPGAP